MMMTRTAMHPLKILAAVGAAFLLWGLVLASPAHAATLTVNSTTDTTDTDGCTTDAGGCTLREAINAANSSSGVEDTIDFDVGESATITLSSQLPAVTDSAGFTGVNIVGGNADITVSGNKAVRVFEVASGAMLTLNNLTVANGNSADNVGGGILNAGLLTVNNSTFTGNSAFVGGAIANPIRTVATVNNSTFIGNSASIGGAISNEGTLTVNNSTLSGNSASSGGAIVNEGLADLTVNSSTFTGNNFSPAIEVAGTRRPTLENTIVANNPGGDCFGTITDNGYNLDSDGSCAFNPAANSLSGVDPLLGPLADNGGPTRTHALLPGSPAIDKGLSFGARTDQRGEPRPHDFTDVNNAPRGDGSDIGAFELQPPALSIHDVSVTEGDSGTTAAVFTVGLSRASTQTVTVDFATADGTAIAGADYVAGSGTITFDPGETSKTVTVLVDEDTTFEPDETFFVNLSNPTNAKISDAQGKGTITDDDPPPDTTAPTTTVALDPDTPDGQNGWYKSDVHLTVGASDGTGGSGVAETRCVLDPASVPNSFAELPSGCDYTGSGADVSADGQHTLYAASVDAQGNEETPLVSEQFKIDKTAPAVSCDAPSPGPAFVLGGAGGNVTATVTDETSEPVSTSISRAAIVSTVGNKGVSLTGSDKAGNSTTLRCPYTVKYNFLGPFSPIPHSSFQVGSTIPVKFALANAAGSRITDAAARALVDSPCKVKVSFEGGTKNCATYNATTDTFQYNLKVPKNLSSGTYEIVVEVSAPDGSGIVNKESVEVTIRR